MRNQLEVLSEELQNAITRKWPNNDKNEINESYTIELNRLEFGLFKTCLISFTSTSATFVLNNDELKLSDLNLIIIFVNKLVSFYGRDDYDYESVNYSDLEGTDEEDYYPDITRYWESRFDNNCTCALNVMFEDNSATFLITFDL